VSLCLAPTVGGGERWRKETWNQHRFHCRLECAPIVCFHRVRAISIRQPLSSRNARASRGCQRALLIRSCSRALRRGIRKSTDRSVGATEDRKKDPSAPDGRSGCRLISLARLTVDWEPFLSDRQFSKIIQPSSRGRPDGQVRHRDERHPRPTLIHFPIAVYCGNYVRRQGGVGRSSSLPA
jgi:hypothetical protein